MGRLCQRVKERPEIYLNKEHVKALIALESWKDAPPEYRIQRKSFGRSKYYGVYWHKNTSKWRAQLQFGGENYHLGLFDDELDAAHAHVCALLYMRMLHGTSM